MDTTTAPRTAPPEQLVTRRLRPLRLALALSSVAPWVPVEKVYMTQLGFTPGLVALMAAAYAGVVPVLEIPSGILADRWSRRGVLAAAYLCGIVSVAIGAVSHGVGLYVVGALVLGAYFALSSGIVDSVVYDVLVEEGVSSERFEHVYGRLQLWGSGALTISALAGGLIAGLLSARAAYVVTIPFGSAGLVLLFRFREPTIHRTERRRSLRHHLVETGAALRRPGVLVLVVGGVACAAALQMILEFGPLWLVADGAPTAVYGGFTAAMTATLGLGGVLTPHLRLERRTSAAGVTSLLALAAVVLVRGGLIGVVVAQVVASLLMVALGVHFTRLVHDAVPSSLRSGVSSGIGTLSWLTFLPCALLFGGLSAGAGLRGGALLLGTLALVGGLAAVVAGCLDRVTRPCPSETVALA